MKKVLCHDGTMMNRVSKWIPIETIIVTARHSLWDYGEALDDDAELNPKKYRYVTKFKYYRRDYALSQFMRLKFCGGHNYIYTGNDGADYEITAYDATQSFKPLLLEVNPSGTHVRLYEIDYDAIK